MNTYKTNRLSINTTKEIKIDKNVKIEDLDPRVLEVLKKTKGSFLIGRKI